MELTQQVIWWGLVSVFWYNTAAWKTHARFISISIFLACVDMREKNSVLMCICVFFNFPHFYSADVYMRCADSRIEWYICTYVCVFWNMKIKNVKKMKKMKKKKFSPHHQSYVWFVDCTYSYSEHRWSSIV